MGQVVGAYCSQCYCFKTLGSRCRRSIYRYSAIVCRGPHQNVVLISSESNLWWEAQRDVDKVGLIFDSMGGYLELFCFAIREDSLSRYLWRGLGLKNE